MKKNNFLIAFLLFASIVSAQKKPNIVLIMADDMGFSDIGCYGSEIPTPNLDALAANGLRFTQFYNTARCSPTRASLLTGLHPHQAGMGHLAEEKIGITTAGKPGYLGYLNNNCITIAEALKTAGYNTYMAGKWHLGMRDESKWPLQRGFDKFYGILTGATSYLAPVFPRELTAYNKQLPKPTNTDYYTTDAFTDFAIKTVEENDSKTPFFLYLAFNAPHWPLQAKEEDIKKFIGKYKIGWDKIREARLAKEKKLGIVGKDVQLSIRDTNVRNWDSLSVQEQIDVDYRMAVYAAQVYRLDMNVGRLVATLKKRGELDNTLIVFLSDNGACTEPYKELGGNEQNKINDAAVTGNVSYGTGWANVSNTPFRKFKSNLYEGGIATPLIAHWPKGIKAKAGSTNTSPSCLMDILPTFLAVSGAMYPTNFKGQNITALQGKSLLPILTNKPQENDTSRIFYWEQYGFKAIREGDMKAVFTVKNAYDKSGKGEWELFDLSVDRIEQNNLATSNPTTLKSLIAKWNIWAAKSQVISVPVGTDIKE